MRHGESSEIIGAGGSSAAALAYRQQPAGNGGGIWRSKRSGIKPWPQWRGFKYGSVIISSSTAS